MPSPAAPLPIQPFVPLGPQERTALYSHRELWAFASTDPRNELEELSEPLRFQKQVGGLRADLSWETPCA